MPARRWVIIAAVAVVATLFVSVRGPERLTASWRQVRTSHATPAAIAAFFAPVTEVWTTGRFNGWLSLTAHRDADVRLELLDGGAFPRKVVEDRFEFFVGDAGAIPVVISWKPRGFDPGLTLRVPSCSADVPERHRPDTRLDGRAQRRATLESSHETPLIP